ncbi:unnamed protein product [Toxocara canis]|uniref:Protein kinase domain-containing protein n=1 Tax=Toxocara canis TaxID=6265 RepID=A0A183UZS6_TOXCA|nr:unnamed protein product [Toxocara canis]
MSCKGTEVQFDLFNTLIDDTLNRSEAMLMQLKPGINHLSMNATNVTLKKNDRNTDETKTARECGSTQGSSLNRLNVDGIQRSTKQQAGTEGNVGELFRFGTDSNDALKPTDTVYESHDGKKILIVREYDKTNGIQRGEPQPITPRRVRAVPEACAVESTEKFHSTATRQHSVGQHLNAECTNVDEGATLYKKRSNHPSSSTLLSPTPSDDFWLEYVCCCGTTSNLRGLLRQRCSATYHVRIALIGLKELNPAKDSILRAIEKKDLALTALIDLEGSSRAKRSIPFLERKRRRDLIVLIDLEGPKQLKLSIPFRREKTEKRSVKGVTTNGDSEPCCYTVLRCPHYALRSGQSESKQHDGVEADETFHSVSKREEKPRSHRADRFGRIESGETFHSVSRKERKPRSHRADRFGRTESEERFHAVSRREHLFVSFRILFIWDERQHLQGFCRLKQCRARSLRSERFGRDSSGNPDQSLSSTKTSEIGVHMCSSVVSPTSSASTRSQGGFTKSNNHRMASESGSSRSDGYRVDLMIVATSKKCGRNRVHLEAECPNFEPHNIRINEKTVYQAGENDR